MLNIIRACGDGRASGASTCSDDGDDDDNKDDDADDDDKVDPGVSTSK